MSSRDSETTLLGGSSAEAAAPGPGGGEGEPPPWSSSCPASSLATPPSTPDGFSASPLLLAGWVPFPLPLLVVVVMVAAPGAGEGATRLSPLLQCGRRFQRGWKNSVQEEESVGCPLPTPREGVQKEKTRTHARTEVVVCVVADQEKERGQHRWEKDDLCFCFFWEMRTTHTHTPKKNCTEVRRVGARSHQKHLREERRAPGRQKVDDQSADQEGDVQ